AIWLSGSVAFSGRYLIATELRAGATFRVFLHRYDVSTGRALGAEALPAAADRLSLSGRWVAYAAGRRLVLVDAKSGRSSTVAVAARPPVGPVIVDKRILWAERWRSGSRVREVVVR